MEECTQWVTGRPSPCLRPFIDGYVGYRLTGFAPGLHRGLPSRHLTFIVSIGPAVNVVSQADSTRAPTSYHCVVSGLQASAALISHDGNQEGVAIELTPPGCRALLGMPAGPLWNTSVELSDVAGVVGRDLWERLQGLAGWGDRFAACDEVLTRLAQPDTEVVPQLRQAWLTIVRSGGSAPITMVADRVGWRRQHLARLFADEFGLGPKLAARIVRFERARRMLQATPSFVSIAQVAAA
ncbi:MAG TPA: DUF6597 domain-containing transcriptional factor, partial [Acidimicrobiales bacterium]|nr:DUF6597 domain-containing transcriptional factor [Acidimicrobiales bacterium]